MEADFDLTDWFLNESTAGHVDQQLLLPAPPIPRSPSPELPYFEIPPPFPSTMGFFNMDSPSDPSNDFVFTMPPLLEEDQRRGQQPSITQQLLLCNGMMTDSDASDESDEFLSQSSSQEIALYMPDLSQARNEDDMLYNYYEASERSDRRAQREKGRNPSRYIRSTDRPHQCGDCGHTFKRLHDFRRHLITHLASKQHDIPYRWRCCFCDQTFSRFFALKRHHGRKHKHLPFRTSAAPLPPPLSCLALEYNI